MEVFKTELWQIMPLKYISICDVIYKDVGDLNVYNKWIYCYQGEKGVDSIV